MLGPLRGEQRVDRQHRFPGLHARLQFALGVVAPGLVLQRPGPVVEEVRVDGARGIETAVDPGGAENRLEGGGEAARPAPVSIVPGAAAQPQAPAEREAARDLGEDAAVRAAAPQHSQRALVDPRLLLEELLRQQQAEHGVAEELEPLVVLPHLRMLVAEGGMREGRLQELRPPEAVAQARLERRQMRRCGFHPVPVCRSVRATPAGTAPADVGEGSRSRQMTCAGSSGAGGSGASSRPNGG